MIRKLIVLLFFIIILVSCSNNEEMVIWKSLNGKRIEFEEKNGIRDGKYTGYYKTGIVEINGIYLKGKKDGNWFCYYPSGNLKYVLSYKKGIVDGIFKEYYQNGKLKFVIKYKNDSLKSVINYFNENGDSLSKTELLNKGEFLLNFGNYSEKNNYLIERNSNTKERITRFDYFIRNLDVLWFSGIEIFCSLIISIVSFLSVILFNVGKNKNNNLRKLLFRPVSYKIYFPLSIILFFWTLILSVLAFSMSFNNLFVIIMTLLPFILSLILLINFIIKIIKNWNTEGINLKILRFLGLFYFVLVLVSNIKNVLVFPHW